MRLETELYAVLSAASGDIGILLLDHLISENSFTSMKGSIREAARLPWRSSWVLGGHEEMEDGALWKEYANRECFAAFLDVNHLCVLRSIWESNNAQSRLFAFARPACRAACIQSTHIIILRHKPFAVCAFQ